MNHPGAGRCTQGLRLINYRVQVSRRETDPESLHITDRHGEGQEDI